MSACSSLECHTSATAMLHTFSVLKGQKQLQKCFDYPIQCLSASGETEEWAQLICAMCCLANPWSSVDALVLILWHRNTFEYNQTFVLVNSETPEIFMRAAEESMRRSVSCWMLCWPWARTQLSPHQKVTWRTEQTWPWTSGSWCSVHLHSSSRWRNLDFQMNFKN